MDSAFLSQRLSTASIPTRERLSMWREVFGQAMVRIEIEPTRGTYFHAEGTLCALPGAAFASVYASPVKVSRTRRLIADDPEEMLYLITADTTLEIKQGGKEHMLRAGDSIFVRGGEISTITCPSRSHFTNIAIPLDALRACYSHADDLAMRVVPRQNDLLGLLHGYVDMLRLRADAALGSASPLVAGHIRDLIAGIAAADADGPLGPEECGVKAARLRAIKAEIARRLRDPHLNVEDVAKCCGISSRYVRRLFQEQDSSFSAHVLGARLDCAHGLLLHSGQTQPTITALAYSCGFGDLSYFNRSFRRRFGIAPSDLRGARR